MIPKNSQVIFTLRILLTAFILLNALTIGRPVSASSDAQANSDTSTSTVLVIDTSSSMDKGLPTGETKLDAAKSAGSKLLAIIGAENIAGVSSKHQAAIVDFSDTATVDIGFTSDIDSAQNVLSSLYSTGGTAMPKGLRAALDLFQPAPAGKSFIILLSDGLPTTGLNDENDDTIVRDQVLTLATEAGQKGICVHTIGFGDPSTSGSIDENFLRQVAEASGCGSYHNAQGAWELANIYVDLRHESVGNTLLKKSGEIRQDETVLIGDAQVPDNQAMILFTLNWPGSQLDPTIKDPTGKIVDINYPGASILTKDNLVSIIIQNPLAGNWNVTAFGAQVPEQVINYNAVFSVRPNLNPPPPTPVPATPVPNAVPPSSGSPFAILIILLAGGGLMVYVVVQTNKRARMQASPVYNMPAALVGLAGEHIGQSIPLREGAVIGRSFASSIRLSDPSVSREHARIRFVNGNWYIQSAKKNSAIYVNGKNVQAALLSPRDRIRIGSDEFEFRDTR